MAAREVTVRAQICHSVPRETKRRSQALAHRVHHSYQVLGCQEDECMRVDEPVSHVVLTVAGPRLVLVQLPPLPLLATITRRDVFCGTPYYNDHSQVYNYNAQ